MLAIDEARAIARRLRCQPLLDRADAIEAGLDRAERASVSTET
jgi:hypothetical protein